MRLQCLPVLEPVHVYRVLATDSAERDLEEIGGYLIKILCNPLAFSNLLDSIREAYETLQENPYAFASCEDSRSWRIG